MLSWSGAAGFEGISAGAGSGAVAILTDGLGGLNVELSLGGASPFGSEAVSFNAPVAESVDLVGIVESPATRNLATRPNVPVRRRSSLQNQSIGFPQRSQNVAPSMGAATASLEGLGPFHIPRISADRLAGARFRPANEGRGRFGTKLQASVQFAPKEFKELIKHIQV